MTAGALAASPTTRTQALRGAADALAAAGIALAGREARLLVLAALGLRPADLAVAGDAPCPPGALVALDAMLARRRAGEPVARILGEWEFWGLTIRLSPDTLVPRPDTETVVEAALAGIPDRRRPVRLLDLGTGSGCLLVALLSELPRAYGIGLDRAAGAAATARENARANGVASRAAFLASDWGAPLRGDFDLVVANPPYVARAQIDSLAPEVRWHDPRAALDGGPDGLEAYVAILADVPRLLGSGGRLVVEIGHDQSAGVVALARGAGLRDVAVRTDLAGLPRVVSAVMP